MARLVAVAEILAGFIGFLEFAAARLFAKHTGIKTVTFFAEMTVAITSAGIKVTMRRPGSVSAAAVIEISLRGTAVKSAASVIEISAWRTAVKSAAVALRRTVVKSAASVIEISAWRTAVKSAAVALRSPVIKSAASVIEISAWGTVVISAAVALRRPGRISAVTVIEISAGRTVVISAAVALRGTAVAPVFIIFMGRTVCSFSGFIDPEIPSPNIFSIQGFNSFVCVGIFHLDESVSKRTSGITICFNPGSKNLTKLSEQLFEFIFSCCIRQIADIHTLHNLNSFIFSLPSRLPFCNL